MKGEKHVDRRGVLNDDVFSYRVSKEGTLFIAWRGRDVKAVKGAEARKFLERIERTDRHEAQLLMARITGNFKRGNERAKE